MARMLLLFLSAFTFLRGLIEEPPRCVGADLFRSDNLVAWCIVPFDNIKRTPEERALMLTRLGFKKYAYDYRQEHVAEFNQEMEAIKKHGIELTGWWFPATLNAEAKYILHVLKTNQIKTQLWVTGSGGPTESEAAQQARVIAEANRIRPIALAAAEIDCQVGLYNHGGWFGEPANQIAVIKELNLPNVGIVYNLHHGHAHVDHLDKLMPMMLPYLYVVNLNGMIRNGDTQNQKIVPLGQGELDLQLLQTIQNSGYQGPIGILNHTQESAETRLQDNLDGLRWLEKQINKVDAGPRPVPKSWQPPAPQAKKPAISAAQIPHSPDVSALAGAAIGHGDAKRGIELFADAKLACLSCHKLGTHGGTVGPDLSKLALQQSIGEIAESVLWPRRKVKPEFMALTVLTEDGKLTRGYQVGESETELTLRDSTTNNSITLRKDSIEEIQQTGSLMPDGLLAALTDQQRADLVRFLSDLGKHEQLSAEAIETAIAQSHSHTPANFLYDRRPLRPELWPHWNHPVNRDRIYDFYTKQARYFSGVCPAPRLIPEFPGLDGGLQGHWGNQSEATWADGRWNQTILGSLQSGVFHHGKKQIPRSVCVRFGESQQLAACFNLDTMAVEAVWSGKFLTFSDVRHGFMHGLIPAGEPVPETILQELNIAKPTEPIEYRGFYRHGEQVLFLYRQAGVDYLDAPQLRGGSLVREVAPLAEHRLQSLTRGGPAQWPQEIVTAGHLGTERPYAIDTITLPYENPWNALLFCGGHDFLPDGSALVCTIQGDVWRVWGLEGDLKTLRWRRIASGLNHALGLVTVDEQIYVLCRDQLMRLHDLNGDAEIDFYECFSKAFETSPAGHDFICDLWRDLEGRFYTASGNQGIVRLSADGKRAEVLANGLRNPDGLGLTPDGLITAANSEGEWVPASMVCAVKVDSDRSTPAFFGYRGPRNNQPPDLPLAYLPRGLDNSSGGQVYVGSERWGPLSGQLIHLSFGAASHFLLLRDEVDGQMQGAIVPLPGEFLSGAHRGKFNPHDGQLYVTGMAGWGNYSRDDGCFQRVRYTGDSVQVPVGFHVYQNGVALTFAQPVDPAQVGALSNHFAQAWNYRYSGGYGSAEYSARHFGVRGHDVWPIASAHVLEDNRQIFLEIPDLQPVNQLHLNVRTSDTDMHDVIVTVHRLDKPFESFPRYQPVQKKVLPHPILTDLSRALRTKRNRFEKAIPGARAIDLETTGNLNFSLRELSAKPGEPLRLTLKNPDVVPHNWVLAKPGTLQSIGELANKMIADPDAVAQQYIPTTDAVICFTDIVEPNGTFTIHFNAPDMPGRYPFLCTFPGHWMVMNGELVVQ